MQLVVNGIIAQDHHNHNLKNKIKNKKHPQNQHHEQQEDVLLVDHHPDYNDKLIMKVKVLKLVNK